MMDPNCFWCRRSILTQPGTIRGEHGLCNLILNDAEMAQGSEGGKSFKRVSKKLQCGNAQQHFDASLD